MTRTLRLTVVNAAFPRQTADPDALLERYPTLADWCDAVGALARVEVVQRFSSAATLDRDGVRYQFVVDGTAPVASWRDGLSTVVATVRRTTPDVVHVNGLGFPALVDGLRSALGPAVAIVLQDHAGVGPPADGGLVARLTRLRWKAGLDAADAVSFTAAEQAAPWHAAGLLTRARVLAIVESSTRVVATPRDLARERTGLGGAPLVVAIGRLIPGKDPLAALGGFEAFQLAHPAARLALIFQGGPLEDAVRTMVQRSLALQGSVRLVGPVPHAAIGDYLGAADLLLSASRAEGSGYAVIEAMACGVTPVVTAIPPHLAIVGDCGATWTPGDARGCAEALTRAWRSDRAAAAAAARARFDAALSWPALAARTVDAYTALAARHPGAQRP